MTSVQSVLRYPGGKYRARKILEAHITPTINSILSPFFGGGSFELYISGKGTKITGYDKFFVLANLWEQLSANPTTLSQKLQSLLGQVDSPLFKEFQAELAQIERQGFTDEPVDTAAKFLIVNRCSFSGATLSGGFSKESARTRFTQSIINRVRDWDNPLVEVKCGDVFDILEEPVMEDLLFLDPPYLLEEKKNRLYGISGNMHKDFNHSLFRDKVVETDKPFLLTYNNTEEVRELWKNFEIVEAAWAYGMNNSKQSSEIIVKNI